MITYLVCDLKKKKQQVGSTVSLETGRPYVHFTDRCPNKVLRNATRKRPQDFFVFVSEDDGLDTRDEEQFYLDFYHGTVWCYNLSPYAKGGWPLTDEQRREFGAAGGRKNKGKKKSPEHQRKISESLKGKTSPNKGKKMSESQKEKLREAALKREGPGTFTGRRHSEESKEKIKEAKKQECRPIEVTHVASGEVLFFPSLAEACRSLGLNKGHLSSIARNTSRRKTHKGYTAKYV
jgi:group I intron endonuclease